MKNDGFSAVELLITLFISALFLYAGYQLFIQVTKSGAESSRAAKVSNVLYERMRTKASQTSNTYPAGCVPGSSPGSESTSVSNETITDIGQIEITLTVKCPMSSGVNDLFLITAKGRYADGSLTRDLYHAVYTN